ncbi:MAG TPA: PHB depolymerase family esterase [Chloroflexota bacterium]|nr:PHB depolymerase family esterase [Chloroflexota bacterium]
MRAMNRRAFLALTLGSGIALVSGCRSVRAGAASPSGRPVSIQGPGLTTSRLAAGGRSVEQLTVDGVVRRYVRYEPAGLDPAVSVPLVLLLHGRGGSGTIAERLYEMNAQAEAHGFVVAYPDALGEPPTWHAGLGMGGAQGDDVAFVRALVEREANTRPLDLAKLFACGHSSGGMMSYRLAGEASDLFPAVGIVAGSVGVRGPGGGMMTILKPERPVSIIHFHGTDDPLVRYDGGSQRGPVGFLSVAESIGFWVEVDGCDPTPTTETVGTARRETYGGGRDGSEVTLWTIDGGGHEWPKTHASVQPAMRTVTGAGDISATELIWAFFAAHPRGAIGRTS